MVVFIVLNVTSPKNPHPLVIILVDDGVIAGVLVGVGVNDCMLAFTDKRQSAVDDGVGVGVGVHGGITVKQEIVQGSKTYPVGQV